MKITMYSFGFISAIATSSVFLSHALVLIGMIFFYSESWGDPTIILLFFTVTARLMGDWLFWARFFSQDMDAEKTTKNWRSSVRAILLSQPAAIKSVLDMVIDAAIDVTLVYLAFKAAAPPIWILLTFSVCQALGAPIQGMALRIFEKKSVRLFSMIVSVMAIVLALEINGFISRGLYTRLFHLSYFSQSIQMLFVLGAKCLLTGTTVIAKETIAEVIKVETLGREA
jgi:hypothetical protein